MSTPRRFRLHAQYRTTAHGPWYDDDRLYLPEETPDDLALALFDVLQKWGEGRGIQFRLIGRRTTDTVVVPALAAPTGP
jgi:hypothetical protein